MAEDIYINEGNWENDQKEKVHHSACERKRTLKCFIDRYIYIYCYDDKVWLFGSEYLPQRREIDLWSDTWLYLC